MTYVKKIKGFLSSDKFLLFILAFFAFQAILYACLINYGIPSDEIFHFNSIVYYAHQSLWAGPFTGNQSLETVETIQSIDRNISYLFAYLLSFPVRLMEALKLGVDIQVLVLRFINIAFALSSLYLLKRCFDELVNNKIIKNLALLAFTLTSMSVWLAGSINYDNLALLLFLGFILQIIRLIKQASFNRLLLILILGVATVLTKYSYGPVVLFGVGVTAIYAHKNYGLSIKKYKKAFFNVLAANKFKTVLLVVLSLIFLGLAVERAGVNLVRYDTVEPKCDQTFSVEKCREYPVYNRNYVQQQSYNDQDRIKLVRQIDPFTHLGEWIYGMYNTLFFYLGHKRIQSTNVSEFFAFLLVGLFGVTAVLSRRKIKMSAGLWFILGALAIYVLALYIYNLGTYVNIGEKFAWQGRYLIPILGFFYLFCMMIIKSTFSNLSSKKKPIFIWAWGAALFFFLATHATPLIFFVGADSSWYNDVPLPKGY